LKIAAVALTIYRRTRISHPRYDLYRCMDCDKPQFLPVLKDKE